MRAFSGGRPRRSLLAGLLVLVLLSSPAQALRMMLTIRFTPVAVERGPCVGAKPKLQRKTPPPAIEVTRPLVVRKAAPGRASFAFDRSAREGGAAGPDPTGLAVLWCEGRLKLPAYLLSFLPSSPQNPVYPPAEPDPFAG